jgi:hypothetical protein
MMPTRTVGILVATLALLGLSSSCDDGGDADADGDVDTDSDADGDADTDGDADGDGSVALTLHPRIDPLTAYSAGPSLIVAEVTASTGLTVDLSATVTPEIPIDVEPAQLSGSGAAELFLRPTADDVGETFSIEVRAETSDLEATATLSGEVVDWEDEGSEYSDPLLATFLTYIQENHAELDLGPETMWTENWDPNPQTLVVNHRAYLSETWHLYLGWHVTIPPDDWAYLLVRRRDEPEPQIAFCLPSQINDQTIQEADLEDPRLPCAE